MSKAMFTIIHLNNQPKLQLSQLDYRQRRPLIFILGAMQVAADPICYPFS